VRSPNFQNVKEDKFCITLVLSVIKFRAIELDAKRPSSSNKQRGSYARHAKFGCRGGDTDRSKEVVKIRFSPLRGFTVLDGGCKCVGYAEAMSAHYKQCIVSNLKEISLMLRQLEALATSVSSRATSIHSISITVLSALSF